TVIGLFSDEILKILEHNGIKCIASFPDSKFDRNYIEQIQAYVRENQIDIVHAFNGKCLRNVNIALKDIPVKLITYMGSTSLYWHDPSAYLTYLNPRIDAIICNSAHVYKHVKKQLFGNRKQKAVKIYKGYDPTWFEDSNTFDYTTINIPENAIKVCLAANYLKVKGIEYFIKSSYHLEKNNNIHYILLGDMRGNKTVPELVAKSPIKKRIHVMGSQKNAVSFFKGADIYVQTSNNEGFGRAISEAMCSKKPIIMTDAGGCTELIDVKSGIVVPKKNPKAIAAAILKLAEDKELRLQMGKAAFERIQKTYSIEKTIDETLALYKNTLNS
ncbi:MAG: glycosyltransferase family 4 protein, partial [Flavicella sp.]